MSNRRVYDCWTLADLDQKLIKRLVLGGYEAIESGKGTAGVAAITLHGRSKQQRYTRSADWSYIAECSSLIGRLKRERSVQADTSAEVCQLRLSIACGTSYLPLLHELR
jgi:hypothetical protein